jgi:hypothetical protein
VVLTNLLRELKALDLSEPFSRTDLGPVVKYTKFPVPIHKNKRKKGKGRNNRI